jgi:hypothetical protein
MATIQLRRDTAANWASRNPVLADGEPGYDKTNSQLRIGNGTSPWSSLPVYSTGGGTGGGGGPTGSANIYLWREVAGVYETIPDTNPGGIEIVFIAGNVQPDTELVPSWIGLNPGQAIGWFKGTPLT